MSLLGRQKKAARKQMGYDPRPPRCMTCEFYVPPRQGHPSEGAMYQAPHCGLGSFIVKPYAICSLWTGRDGEVLEDE